MQALLATRRADVNVRNKVILRLLIDDCYACANRHPQHGRTALDIAKERKKIDIVAMLQEYKRVEGK